MQVEVYPDAQGAGRAAARTVARYVQVNPAATLGLATGHTMIPVFGELVRLHHEENISFASAKTFNLDEYAGADAGHPDSFHHFMKSRLISQIDLPEESFHILDGIAPDLGRECEKYEELIKAGGGIGLQLLGLGRNGHIAFNEPGSDPASRTRPVELTSQTRDVNSGDFRKLEATPARALTMGIGTILEAGKILLVVTGWEKSDILFKVLTTRPTADIPATFLHRHHDVTLVADIEAMETFAEVTGNHGLSFRAGPREE